MGDIGPAGGIVFYVSEDGLHGLEAATEVIPGNPEWGCIFTEMNGAGGVRVGIGRRDTGDMLRGCLEADKAAVIRASSR